MDSPSHSPLLTFTPVVVVVAVVAVILVVGAEDTRGVAAEVVIPAVVVDDLLEEVALALEVGLLVADIRAEVAGARHISVVASPEAEFARLDHNSVVPDEPQSVARHRSVSLMQVDSKVFVRLLAHLQVSYDLHNLVEDGAMEFNRAEISGPTVFPVLDNHVPTL